MRKLCVACKLIAYTRVKEFFRTQFNSFLKSKKSGTVMLVKNLPHGTTMEELRSTFDKFGDLDRLLLPPSGVSAIVEFLQPTEARVAFRSLAYTKVITFIYILISSVYNLYGILYLLWNMSLYYLCKYME